MTANEIKAKLAMLGITQAEIAREQGVSRCVINAVVHNRLRTKRHRAAVAKAIRLPFDEVWGSTGCARCQSPTASR